MRQVSFKRHRFPPDVIRYAVWPNYRKTLSLRDVEELHTERGIDVTCETVRCRAKHQPGRLRYNNRAENSHNPVRRRERFKSQGQAQHFVSTHSAIYNTFKIQRHLISRKALRTIRSAAMAEWLAASAATARM